MIYVLVAIISLCIGSFLNVVIYRLPTILKREWREECESFLGLPKSDTQSEIYNLSWPSSHCPNCKHKLRWWHNIPLVSFLALRGRCAFCQESIAWRYPLIEFLTVLLSLTIVFHFGMTWEAGAALIFTWTLIVITFIDFDHQLIPDRLSLALMWMGLLLNTNGMFVSPGTAILGAAIGYFSLWFFTFIFRVFTGKQGMGHGDFKLLAAFGAWMGWQPLLLISMIASSTGAIAGGVQLLLKKMRRDSLMPFGPFLALGGWIALLYGQRVLAWYLGT